MAWLYRYEAKGIQSYVLGTQKLKEIAGASRLVDDLPKRVSDLLRELPEAQPISLAAGNGMIRFGSKESLAEFAKHWPMLCARLCPDLQMVQAWAELGSETPEDHRKATKTLFERAEAARMRPVVSLPEAGPWMARSGRTGLPAIRTEKSRGGLLDAASAKKQDEFREAQREGGLAATLLDRVNGGATCEFINDNEQFSEGYIAVIHADGDSIGKLFMSGAISPGDVKTASDALSQATQTATVAAIEAVIAAEREPRLETRSEARTSIRQLPLRPVVLGGDDLTAIVEGRYAIVFTCAFLETFESETRRTMARWLGNGGRLTASAGIAFVKPSFPFHAAYALAEELCGSAKKALSDAEKQTSVSKPSTLQFHRVTTAAVDSWQDIVEGELSSSDMAGKQVIPGALCGGPWRLGTEGGAHALSDLLDLVKLFGHFDLPRGSLREWTRSAQSDRERAEKQWARILEVLHARLAKGELDSLKRTLGNLDVQESGWRRPVPVQDPSPAAGEDPSADPTKGARFAITTPVADALTLRAIGIVTDIEPRVDAVRGAAK